MTTKIDAVAVLREALSNLINLDRRSGWHSKEQDAAIAALAATERAATQPAGEVEQRYLRAGCVLHAYAKKLGWMDDGEGALEFVVRFVTTFAAPISEDSGNGEVWRCRDCCEWEGTQHAATCGVARGTVARAHCGDCPVTRTPAAPSVTDGDTLTPLPEPAHRGPDGTGSYFNSFTADQMHAYVLADRAARTPASVGSIDTPKFRDLLLSCAMYLKYRGRYEEKTRDLIAYIDNTLNHEIGEAERTDQYWKARATQPEAAARVAVEGKMHAAPRERESCVVEGSVGRALCAGSCARSGVCTWKDSAPAASPAVLTDADIERIWGEQLRLDPLPQPAYKHLARAIERHITGSK